MTVRRAIPLPDPPLSDGRMTLRPWCPGDGPALAAAWADPEVVRWTGAPAGADAAAAERWITGEADRRARGVALDLVIDVDGQVAGEVGIVDVADAPGTAEIGWWVAPDHRGHGIAAGAARLVASWVVDELSVAKVVARCHPDNPASAGVARAAGFMPADGQPADVWLYR